MKRKIIVFLICFQIVLSVASSLLYIVVDSAANDGTEVEYTPVPTIVKSLFPESELEWQSYSDYIKDQAQFAFDYTEAYVDREVAFVPSWDSARVCSGFESDDESIYISLNTEDSDNPNSVNINSLKLIVTDIHVDEDDGIWYKVAAKEGELLPQVLQDHPYVLHIDPWSIDDGKLLLDDLDYYPPTFYFVPQKGMFLPDVQTVTFKETPDADSASVEVNISDLPKIFDIMPSHELSDYDGKINWGDYFVGDIASEFTEFKYVAPEDIILIPADATYAYESMMNAEDTYEYYDVLLNTPNIILSQLSDEHKKQLDICIEALIELEQVKYETTVTIGDISLPIYVTGKLPDNVTLTAELVSNDTIISEGFDIENVEDIIAALDIKLIDNENGTQWQPKEGRRIGVSIGLGALGYEDGSVVKMQHKHGDSIENFDIITVENGFATIYTTGFSIYVAQNTTNDAPDRNPINNNSIIELEVGDDVIYYIRPMVTTTNWGQTTTREVNPTVGAWAITDVTGAIHYNVHANGTPGSDGIPVRYLSLFALRETPTDIDDPATTENENLIKLTYNFYYQNNAYTETYYIRIIPPKADKNEVKLYIRDEVNTTGSIFATLVDDEGKEVKDGLAGAAFNWTRDDGAYIVPTSYGADYSSVNIARDHGGLTEARRQNGGFLTYHLSVILANGKELNADYTVYYQSEFINANFETPAAPNNTYSFFPNGWPNLFWETTAPGTNNNISKDVEYGDVTGGRDGAEYTVEYAADYAEGGVQFAELNAENFGSLYQDIITAPGEDIDWEFSHAARYPSWGEGTTNKMYIVIGPTDAAQHLTSQAKLEALGALAEEKGGDAFLKGETSVVVTFEGAEYTVWYHDADKDKSPSDRGWFQISGSYKVPEGQYRTRLFFASDRLSPDGNNTNPNAGNLIDKAKVGQYKKFLIEYYEQTYDGRNIIIEHMSDYDEKGEALIYSSVKLENYYNHFVKEEHDYLHHVDINGVNHPYDIRYFSNDPNNAYLYIQKYDGTPKDPLAGTPGHVERDYSEYDIVMQVYMRDTVVAVQKQLVFPQLRDDEGNLVLDAQGKPIELLTEEQKLNLMNYFNSLPSLGLQDKAGYQTDFNLSNYDKSSGYNYSEDNYTYITERDPSGNYQSFIALGNNPELGHEYVVEEKNMTQIPGLELSGVTFRVQLYKSGQKYDDVVIDPANYYETHIKAGDPLVSNPFRLFGEVKIADVVVINTYKEKETTIIYKAIGNGKIKLDKEGSVFEDAPSEKLPYYSGQSIGCSTHAGAGATFVGWYKDEACTQRVTAADGVWDSNGSFRPNANILYADTVYFYAKFETGSITIERENAYPNQTFVYHIQSSGATPVDMYVSLECDKNGNGSVKILEVPLGQSYTITECEDWSWRHEEEKSQTKTNGESDEERHLTYEFDSPVIEDHWLNGFDSPTENVFGKTE